MELSQQGRLLQLLSGPIGTTDAVATRFVGSEGLSRPFRFIVDLLSTKVSVQAGDAVGSKLSVMLFGHQIRQDVSTVRLAHGIVARWTEMGVVDATSTPLTRYRAELVPWISLLGLSATTRTYENKAVDVILGDVFDRAGFKGQYKFSVTRTLVARPYTVQYGESDLAFVTRLLEEEALYYRFEFHSDKHILAISDKHGRALPAGDIDTMPIAPISKQKAPLGSVPIIGPFITPDGLPGKAARKGAEAGLAEAGSSIGAVVGTLLAPLGIGTLAGSLAGSGVGALADLVLDYLFTPETQVLGNAVTEVRRERAVHTHGVITSDFHLLRTPDLGVEVTTGAGSRGDYAEFLGDLAGTPTSGVSTVEARRQVLRVEAASDIIRGATTNCALQPGTRVTIKGGLFGSSGTEFQIIDVGHAAESADPRSTDGSKTVKYVNEFAAIPVDTPYAPPRTTAQPSVRGTQTALIVGAGAPGEIDVDDHGRVLVMFPWDQGDGAAQKSQHRVHVASLWAGVGFGAVHWPRVGQLVLVEFLEGNMERPIITGRVYSRQHPFPYTVPANKTQSGVKSRSVGDQATDQNFNELRFEDKKGSEHVFMQAEKDLTTNVKANEARTVGHDRTTTIAHNDMLTVTGGTGDKKGQMRYEMLEGDQYVLVKTGDQVLAVQKGGQVMWAQEGNQTFRVDKGDQATRVEDGNRTVKVDKGNNTATISGTDATSADTITLTAQTKIELKVGASVITMEPTTITIKTGPSKIVLDPGGVAIQGVQVTVDGKAMAGINAPTVNVEGKAMTSIKGAMTAVNGSAMLMANGGITMIG